ncbi:MAG TPA: histidine kinase [Candidatus Dormibacteraeota bacterium]|nr:histidine kinase [Candidatus Dormibacteraeota bacterium]
MRQITMIARRLDIHWIDVVLAVGLSIWAVVESTTQDSQPTSPAVLLNTIPLLVRRRYPVAVLALDVAGYGLAGNATVLAALIGGLVACVSVGLHSRHQNLALAAVAVASLFIAIEFGHGPTSTLPVPGAVLPFLLLGAAYLAGREIGARQKQLNEERRLSARLNSEREAAIKAAAEAERQHIARELHDVVAHSVSVMVVQAGAARKVLAEKPDAARESLENVETVGHEAMDELRRLLGVLGANGSEPPLVPQPSMGDLTSLVERVKDAGLPVSLEVQGEARPLAPGVDVAAYRIVQEALTNALKYAGGAQTNVLVRYLPDALDIEIADQGMVASPADGIGRGLVGMRERVALFGGTIDAGKRPTQGYAVRAHLPLSLPE